MTWLREDVCQFVVAGTKLFVKPSRYPLRYLMLIVSKQSKSS